MGATQDSIRNLLSQAKDEDKLYIYYELAESFIETNIDSSIYYANALLDFSNSINDDYGKGMANFILGIYYHQKGKFIKAISSQNEALKFFEKIQDTISEAKTLINLGIEFQTIGNYEKALSYFQKAEKYSNRLNDSYLSSLIFVNIGKSYEDWGRYEMALEHFLTALDFAKKSNSKETVEPILHNIGVEYNNLRRYQLATQYFDSAKLICEELNLKEGMFYVYYDYGNSYLGLEEVTNAKEAFQQSLSISKDLSNPILVAKAKYKLGFVFQNMKQYAVSIQNFREALQISKRTKESKLTKDILLALSKVLKESGDDKSAYEYYQQYALVKDSIFQDRSQKLLVDMEVKYEMDKKEKEIQIKNLLIEKQKNKYFISILISIGAFVLFALLGLLIFNRYRYRQRHYQSELEKKNIEIEQRLLRTQMNPHFIFNSLNSISNFILTNKPAIAQSYLAKFARLMRLILDNSREKMISVDNEVETLQLYLELERLRFNEIFDFSISIDAEIDQEFTFIPPMLIQPFVENAIIHGLAPKDDKGLLTISFMKRKDWIKVMVEDDGIGRVESRKRKDLSTIPKHRSLGMQVTKERLAILKAELKLDISMQIIDGENNDVAAGTKVVIHIPFEEE
jgi:sensor histidine kinase YesM/Flp pilus assembly protein TadD